MTTALFRRNVQVIVRTAQGGLAFEKLFIKFEVKREVDSASASGKIEIYNLNESNETRIRERGQPIKLLAGYGDRLDLLAEGTTGNINREREGLDRITRIEYRGNVELLIGATFNRAYRGLVPVRHIVRDAIEGRAARRPPPRHIVEAVGTGDLSALPGIQGLSLGALDAIPGDATEMDFSFGGPVKKLLTQLLRPLEVEWYEDNGIIRFSRRGMSTDDRVVMISEDSGMIGSPTITEKGIKVRMLLDPRLGLDSRIRVESRVRGRAASGDAANQRVFEASGEHKVLSLVHQGDNRGGEFFTEVEAKRL